MIINIVLKEISIAECQVRNEKGGHTVGIQLFHSPIANCQIFSVSGIQGIFQIIEKDSEGKPRLDSARIVIKEFLEQAYVKTGKRIALVDIHELYIPHFNELPKIEVSYSMSYKSTYGGANRAILFLKDLQYGLKERK